MGWGGWGGGFDVGVEPAALFPEHVLEAFFGFVAVGFSRQPDEADGGALAGEELRQRSSALDGKVPWLSSASPCMRRMGVLILSA